MKKIRKFFNGVKKEFSRIKWPSIKELSKYTGATLVFCVIFAGFFYLVDVIFALVKGWLS